LGHVRFRGDCSPLPHNARDRPSGVRFTLLPWRRGIELDVGSLRTERALLARRIGDLSIRLPAGGDFQAERRPGDHRQCGHGGVQEPGGTRWTSDDPETAARLARRWTRPILMDTPVLTDDYAPVEVYMMKWFF